ncbi:MAG TPA: TetR/AcrR family transcriptional regulator [Acidimicrobiales bacterium]|jgi:AcrR family transcriptional regulator|nr:TetR/AcrR family transcriptional regulator [Acidimicrobiales bacterium]
MAGAEPTVVARGPGRPRRTPEARAAQRARLLDGAFAAVRRHGPDASVEEMAAEAGVSKPVLYAEFGDKYGIADAMAVELVEQGERALMGRLADDPELGLTEALRLAVEGFFDVVTADPAVYGFIFRSIRREDRGLLDNALMRSLQARFEMVAGVLVPGADADVVRVLAHGTFGFIISAIESWSVPRRPPREEAIGYIVTVLASGLLAASGGVGSAPA